MKVDVATWQRLKVELWEACRDGRIQVRHLERIISMTTEEMDASLGVSPEELEESTHGVL